MAKHRHAGGYRTYAGASRASNVTSATPLFERLSQITSAFAAAVSLQRVAAIIVEQASQAAEADSVTLALRGRDEEWLEVIAGTGFDTTVPRVIERVPLTESSPIPAAVRMREPVFITSPLAKAGTWAALPLTVRNRTIGAVGFRYEGERGFDDETRAYLLALANICAFAVERAQLHEMEQASRMEAEEEHERFRTLVNELDAIFWESDPRVSKFSFVSQRAPHVLGHPVESWAKEGFFESIIHEADREWVMHFCLGAADEGHDHMFEHRATASDGRLVWLRDIVYVVRDREGNPSKLRGVMMDITRERERASDGDEKRVARLIGQQKSRASGFFPAALKLLTPSDWQ